MIIELPWPHRDLSPNSRKHWRNRWSKGKVAKHQAMVLTSQALCRNNPPLSALKAATGCHLRVSMLFVPPSKRHYDLDNLVARMKYPLDGIAEALDVNDKDFTFGTIARCEPAKPGRVLVTIEEFGDATEQALAVVGAIQEGA